ncbi:MAG: SCO family protein [Proteobacteria bacterium]|nr:SCO family protein [Pseudomonadota bacterium]MCG6934352.1 SCO family protein [Pseudomonadota bacterium]
MSKLAPPIRTTLLLMIIALASLAGGYWLSQYLQTTGSGGRIPEGLEATVLDPPRSLTPFTLQDHNGKPFTEQSLLGHWSFLFFGYTHCPDVCPIVLQVMQVAWQQIPHAKDDPAAPRLYFISVDPDRDTPALLKQYVQYFDPAFIGVTGQADEIDKLTNRIGVLYGFEDKQPGSEDYQVNHSAQIILIDPQGRMRAVISPPHDPATIARNFTTIRDFYGD